MERYSYPETLYEAPKIPDYSSFAKRKNLSSSNLRRYFMIMKRWKVEPKDARMLLGGITSQRFMQLSANSEGRILSQDQLLRVTIIIAIDSALHKLLSGGQANNWVKTQSGERRFRGRTPLGDMVDGGILTMWEIHRQLEALASERSEVEK